MNNAIINFIILLLSVFYFMLPAYISNISGLALGGGKPLDMGKNFRDNRRIIGDGVTWRGLIAGTITGTLIGGLQAYFNGYIVLITNGSFPIVFTNIEFGLTIGFLLGFGALLGDAAGSFLKRRINIERGKPAPILDQLDFVAGALILSSVFIKFDLNFILIACILSVILHLFTNIVAYLIGIKNVWY